MQSTQKLTGLQRTREFIHGGDVDRPPFHPIIMRWAAKYAAVKYRDFCLNYQAKCEAMIKCARDFDMDWVTVMSDPYAEASAFGIQCEYPENDLPKDVGGHFPDPKSVRNMKPFNATEHVRPKNRLDEIREFKRLVGDELFIVGWVEGPVAEYADLRGVTNAALDFMDDPDTVGDAMEVIVENAMGFITHQVESGAHCIGIGDAFCSQIGPDLYRLLAFEREKRMVAHIHSLGALAKLHICGNIKGILPDMIRTGADIIDVDHLVPSMAEFVGLLGKEQIFSGKSDPVSVIQDGDARLIENSVRECNAQTKGRCIVSAGCEITPGTSIDNMRAYMNASKTIGKKN